MLELELTIEYDNERIARSVLDAVAPDNGQHVLSTINGNVLKFSMRSDNAGTLKNTADDLMACIKIAEEASGLAGSDLDSDALLE